MANIVEREGQLYSLIYCQRHELFDSPCLRYRVRIVLEKFVQGSGDQVGRRIEARTGTRVLRSLGSRFDIDWDKIEKCRLEHFLDYTTLVLQYYPGDHRRPAYIQRIREILVDMNAAYWMDDNCGIHPMIDTAFSSSLASAIRGLDSSGYESARAHIERADQGLMPNGDLRQSIVSVFDALENIFKYNNMRATHLKSSAILQYTRPKVEPIYSDGIERRAAEKILSSFMNWTDCCHNYRHESGSVEMVSPARHLTVVVVSQGISYLRWLIEIEGQSVKKE